MNRTVTGKATEKTIRAHSLVVLAVCLLFGTLSLIKGNTLIGGGCYALGILIPAVSLGLMKNASIVARGTFLIQATIVVITFLAGGSSTLYSMVTMLLANIAIATIYYDPRNIRIAWVLTNIVLIAAFPFREQVYGLGADVVTVIKGIVAVNIGSFMLHLLMQNSIALIIQAREEATHIEELLAQVEEKMAESEELNARQSEIMREVADAAGVLETTSSSMLEISTRLTAASEEQSSTIADIHNNVGLFAQETEDCHSAALKASDAARQSSDMMQKNSESMTQMVSSMKELEETSGRIGSIIKTIDDISFQTNILALNAAVEAARAGAAGKGFAVVADEVRNLAAKSAEAAKTTSELLGESIKGVQRTTALAQDANEYMNEVIRRSRESEEYAHSISELTAKQKTAIAEIEADIAAVSGVISNNTDTALGSADIARSVLDEATKLNRIVAGN